jgi:hypothetical protein
MDDDIEIHFVKVEELPTLIDWFTDNYYDNRQEAESHFADHYDVQGATFLAKHDGEIAGYITVGISWLKKIPLIVNFVVFEPY